MPKTVRLPIAFLCLAMLAPAALADTVTLKSGERLEGTVTRDTATEIELEIKETAGIVDHRTIKKADISKIDRLAADEVAYRAIMFMQPASNSLQPAQYEPILAALRSFTDKFPTSPHDKDVQVAIKAFEIEKKRVDAGEVKFDGTWLSKDEAPKLRVQIGGVQAFNAMKTANASGDAIGALNAFAVLEKNFPGAKTMPDAVDLARQILVGLKPVVQQAIVTSKVILADRQKGIADAGPRDRPEMTAALQRELAQADAAATAAANAGLWPPYNVISEKSLTAISAKVAPEIQRLEKIPVGPMRESVKLAEKAQAELAAGNFTAATETLKNAAQLWPTNELAIRLQAQATAARVAAATPVPATPPPATPKPAATPAATPKPATPAATANSETSNAAQEGSPQTAEEKKEGEKSFFMTLPGAITIILVLAALLGGLNVFNKMRQRSNETLE